MRIATLISQIPSGRLSAEEIICAAGRSQTEARIFSRLFGMDEVSAFQPNSTYEEEMFKVVDALEVEHRFAKPRVLIIVQGNPIGRDALSGANRLVRTHGFLSKIERVFFIDQHNCAGMFWAIEMARRIVGKYHAIALLAGDCHIGLPLTYRYVPGCSILGDACVGMVLDDQPGGHRIESVRLTTYPVHHPGRSANPSEMDEFFAAHDGMISAGLSGVAYRASDRAPILPHNVNRLAWQRYCQSHQIPLDQVDLGLLPDVGHCFTTDPFLLLDRLLRNKSACPDHATLISVGMGAFVGSCKAVISPGQLHDNSNHSFSEGYTNAPALA